MERVAFCLRLRKGSGEAYDQAHREVWPEMLALLKRLASPNTRVFVGMSYRHLDSVAEKLRLPGLDPTCSGWIDAFKSARYDLAKQYGIGIGREEVIE